MKKCCRCQIIKESVEFTKNKCRTDGLAEYCKLCMAIYRSEKREEIRKHKKKYRDNNKEKRRLYENAYRAKDRSKARYYNAKYTYGLEKEEYDLLLSKQKCDICETTDSGSKIFHVDHCHKTGIVRGLLCNKCNLALGGFKDNTILLLKAIEYLKKGLTFE